MVHRRWLGLAVALAACGDDLPVDVPDPPVEALAIVGHSDLGARGMNAALAVVGDTVYVGSRIDQRGVAIVDVSDPTRPAVVGELGRPDEGLPSMSSRELRAVPELDLLIVLNLACPAPLPAVAVEDPGLGGHPVAMWSYPVVQDGLIYVVDIRNGLYILRYEGKHAAQLDAADFLEGNSNR